MLRSLSFAAPQRLWLLALLAALGLGAWLLRRRRRAEPYADAALLPSVAPHRLGWRRPVAATGLVLSTIALTAGFAKPEVVAEQARERAVVMVALDTSSSMLAQDVSPDRFTAAKDAAKTFIRGLPARIDVGLVTYNASARLVVPPTDGHEEVAQAVDALTMSGGTAQGDALLIALRAALQDLSTAEQDGPPPIRIVLLSDGGSTTGTPVPDAVAAAQQAQVPVSTIAYGTPDGVVVANGTTFQVPVDTAALEAISVPTGGVAYQAATPEQLRAVYDDIGSQLIKDTEREDVSDAFAGAGLLLLLATAIPSLAWSSRLVP